MKKLRLFAVGCALFGCFGVVYDGWAQCNTPVVLGFDGFQKPADNEFLYENEDAYKLTQQGYINTGKQTSGDGLGYECDRYKSPSCTIDDVVTMPANHVFEGVTIPNETKYQCQIGYGFDDRWVVVDDGTCATKGFGNIAVGNCVGGTGNCRTLTDVDCSGYEKTDPSGTKFHGMCLAGPKFICKAVECREGMVANSDGKCVVKNSVGPSPDPEVKPKPSCKESRSTAEGKACCDLTELEATWDGKYCNCTVGKFRINPATGLGECVAKVVDNDGNNDTPFSCSEEFIAKLNAQLADTNTPADAKTKIRQILQICAGTKPDQNQIRNILIEIKVIINYYNGNGNNDGNNDTSPRDDGGSSAAAAQATKITNARQYINVAMSGIKDIESKDLKISKWKDADGNFNTARLASDSIAGVVLGTAGGLITSSVVKKNQIKKGFEDISCTIGGQTVAGWGDTFTVGAK